MKGPLNRTITYSALIVSISLCLANPVFANGTIIGTVALDGKVTGTGTGPRDQSANYDGKYKVTVNYSVATKTDSSGKKVFDLTKSKAKFTDSQYNWTTSDIPITKIKGDPATGKIESFEFKGTKWYPGGASDGVVDNGISGSVKKNKKNPAKGTGWIKASYKDTTGATESNYSFATAPKKPGRPKKNKKTKSKIPKGKSIDFDAVSGILSIHDDLIVGTPDLGDPLLGASVLFPEFMFTGFTLDESLAVFWATDDTPYQIEKDGEIFERSSIPLLYYFALENIFYASLSEISLGGMAPSSPFYDPDLTSISSLFISFVDEILNPLSIDYDPKAHLFISITPDIDFLTLTDSFQISGSTGATDGEFVARAPEPSTLILLGFGLLGLRGHHWWQKKRLGNV